MQLIISWSHNQMLERKKNFEYRRTQSLWASNTGEALQVLPLQLQPNWAEIPSFALVTNERMNGDLTSWDSLFSPKHNEHRFSRMSVSLFLCCALFYVELFRVFLTWRKPARVRYYHLIYLKYSIILFYLQWWGWNRKSTDNFLLLLWKKECLRRHFVVYRDPLNYTSQHAAVPLGPYCTCSKVVSAASQSVSRGLFCQIHLHLTPLPPCCDTVMSRCHCVVNSLHQMQLSKTRLLQTWGLWPDSGLVRREGGYLSAQTLSHELFFYIALVLDPNVII